MKNHTQTTKKDRICGLYQSYQVHSAGRQEALFGNAFNASFVCPPQIVLCLLVGEKITNPNPSPIRKKFGFANFGDPYGNRTHVTAVKGRCLNRLTNGPGSGNLIRTDDIPGMNRLLYQLSYAAMCGQRVSAPPKPACVL